ncbi:hypothetical protein HHK36_026800 [Tetracentron sinense]|uniref:Nuclease HARBI1 n=1 Tax=Tetracentron sinense TaxID=13715 RepID=A0A834YGL0_TETSI|nr:hypothetical protein HHK36_026800 [Tetracentron sinense]
MDRNLLNNMFFGDLEDSDEELEIMTIACMEEERLNKEKQSRRHRGSVQGHRVIWHDRVQGHERLFQHYFAETLVYPPILFRRRFRMQRSLFLRIQYAVEAHDPYFVQKTDAFGMLGLSSLQKITAAMRMLSYGVAAAYMDKLLAVGEHRGFPGMLGSIDCMHWKWKNCPTAWKGMYCGHVHEPMIILEAVASYDLGIWHAFFGLPGSHNDINVLERSSVFTDLTDGCAVAANYSISGNDYAMGYYLADGIYSQWSTFVKTILSPQGNKQKYFTAAQESARKDVERAFGVLQARFAIVRGPAHFWKCETLKDIMKTCIIMHNMIVEDERDVNGAEDFNYDAIDESPYAPVSHERTTELVEFIEGIRRIRNRGTHSQLQSDLVEH